MKIALPIIIALAALAFAGFLYQRLSVQTEKITEYRWLVIESQIAQMEIHLRAISEDDSVGSQRMNDVVNESLMRSIMFLNLEALCKSELDETSRKIFQRAARHLSENLKDSNGEMVPFNFTRFEC